MPNFGDSYIFGVLYTASSGTAHSAQYALAEMMKASVEERLDFVSDSREYGRRAEKMMKSFEDNGFHLVYEKDGDRKISDGFFFTAGYRDLDSETLQKELMRYGISSISLPSTGSVQNGVRVCVSMMKGDESFEMLDQRLRKFKDEH